jgi:CSLREA domain-containing protein
MKRVLLLVTLALMLAAAMALSGGAHADTTFRVNTTGDENDLDFPGGTFDNSSDGRCDVDGAASGRQCTLRAAIQEANETDGADTINFNIPGTGVKTIRPDSELPFITEQVTINGYTQTDSRPNTLAKGNDAVLNIELDGTNAVGVEGADGLVLAAFMGDASNSVVRGLVINNFDDGGIKADANNVKIEGNFLGTDPSGTHSESNDWGVRVVGGADNTIGGSSPEARNLISGNDEQGVFLEPQSEGNSVLGNYIGTKRNGTSRLGNDGNGVFMLGSHDNRIGGTTAAEANTIAFNSFSGVAIDEFDFSDANGNRILINSIFSNGELGIDLDDSPTPNDRKDRDEGPNTLQNKPVLESAETTGTRIFIEGHLNSTPNQTFTIRFFANPVFSPAGYEGKRYLGLKRVTTDENGDASFTRQMAGAVRAGQVITATATGPGGNTSEFSGPRQAVQQ